MLRPGFLGALSGWVSDAVCRNASAIERAVARFGLGRALSHETHDCEESADCLSGLFSEWLVFDYRQKLFQRRTGLEYFVSHNPLMLPESERVSYEEMLGFEVGLFEVRSVRTGEGAALASLRTEFANQVPRAELGGKTPMEAFQTMGEKEEGGMFEVDSFSYREYEHNVKAAEEHMRAGRFNASVETFESVIKRLFDDRVPFFHSFKFYANSAVCCFHKNDTALGTALVDAALRINPLYDFAASIRHRYVEPYENFSAVPKNERTSAHAVWETVRKGGVTKYRRTAFRKYEKFLSDIGVSLAYRTKTTPIVFTDEDNSRGNMRAIGRNDPCQCASGKKFKRCCGRDW